MVEELEERLIAIESHLAHQAEETRSMGELLTRHWRTMEELTARLSRLEDQLRSVEAGLEEVLGPEPPPPHY